MNYIVFVLYIFVCNQDFNLTFRLSYSLIVMFKKHVLADDFQLVEKLKQLTFQVKCFTMANLPDIYKKIMRDVGDYFYLFTFEWFMTLFLKCPPMVNNEGPEANSGEKRSGFKEIKNYFEMLVTILCLDGEKALVKTSLIHLAYSESILNPV